MTSRAQADEKARVLLEAAEFEILGRRNVTIPAKDWAAFKRWMNRPPQELAGLRALAKVKPSWEK